MALKVTVFLLVCSIVIQAVVNHPTKGEINSDEIKKTNERICGQSTPCGWAVYEKLTRTLDYFMKNKCTCPKETECIREEDDISINAFIYRCKTKES